MFHHPIIVARYRAGANIGPGANMRIANVGQVVDFGALVERAGLDFDKITNFHILRQFSARAQAGIGANDTTARDMRTFQM